MAAISIEGSGKDSSRWGQHLPSGDSGLIQRVRTFPALTHSCCLMG